MTWGSGFPSPTRFVLRFPFTLSGISPLPLSCSCWFSTARATLAPSSPPLLPSPLRGSTPTTPLEPCAQLLQKPFTHLTSDYKTMQCTQQDSKQSISYLKSHFKRNPRVARPSVEAAYLDQETRSDVSVCKNRNSGVTSTFNCIARYPKYRLGYFPHPLFEPRYTHLFHVALFDPLNVRAILAQDSDLQRSTHPRLGSCDDLPFTFTYVLPISSLTSFPCLHFLGHELSRGLFTSPDMRGYMR